ncbi:hypothetical protein M885DRAFT_579996 [Pelagophyceae sp. CCMP2097]|nr:hypothetical protein M885DRAFT_579996 [Pelagophyceae sp. CCMP2097]
MPQRSSTHVGGATAAAGPAAGVAAGEEPATGAVDVAVFSGPWPTVASNVGIVLGLGLGAALLTEIVLVVRVFLRRERHHQQDGCDEAASAITTWGHWLAGEAYALGKQLYKMRHAPSVHSGANSHMMPSVIWNPTVLDADREAYEAFMSNQFGFPINISHIEYMPSQGRESATKVPAPRAAVYHPMSFFWSVLGDAVGDPTINALRFGSDMPPSTRERPNAAKLLFQRRHIAHTPFADFGAVTDDLLMVQMPFCGIADCEDSALVGFFTFIVSADNWSELFPDNSEVIIASTGAVLKTPDRKGGGSHWNKPMFALNLCAAGAVAAIVALLAQDYHQRRRAAEAQWREQLEKVTADRHELKNIFEAKLVERSEANERMERYVNHEIKNRLVILSQLCSEEAQLELVDEMAETLNEKMARLDETMDHDSLIDKRLQRHREANCAFLRMPTTGTAAAAASALRLDSLLAKIVFDNILSNAFKYGSPTIPPSLAIHLEPDGSAHVNLVVELTKWAGPEHAALLTMGEAELNHIAGAEGERAHASTANTMSSGSSGDGFPMAVVAARALGGTLRLRLSEGGVVAHLVLSGVGRASSTTTAAATEHIIGEARPVDPSQLMVAIADDSSLQRKIFKKHIGKIAPQGPPVLVAGDTRESIDEFARVVCAADVDVVFTDQHFAPIHHTMAGTDIVREIRARDAAAGRSPRLVFVASGNDSPEDTATYVEAGADGSLSKISSPQLKILLERHATTAHSRFEARARCSHRPKVLA